MSWKFAGIAFEKNYVGAFSQLLAKLQIGFTNSNSGFTFLDAIAPSNRATALGIIHHKTLLLHHLWPYDVAYEPDQTLPLDPLLSDESRHGQILSFIIDGMSATYAFALFDQGQCVRRWGVAPGNTFCNEGVPLVTEAPHSLIVNADQPTPDESHIFGVLEGFLGIPFQTMAQSKAELFEAFL